MSLKIRRSQLVFLIRNVGISSNPISTVTSLVRSLTFLMSKTQNLHGKSILKAIREIFELFFTASLFCQTHFFKNILPVYITDKNINSNSFIKYRAEKALHCLYFESVLCENPVFGPTLRNVLLSQSKLLPSVLINHNSRGCRSGSHPKQMTSYPNRSIVSLYIFQNRKFGNIVLRSNCHVVLSCISPVPFCFLFLSHLVRPFVFVQPLLNINQLDDIFGILLFTNALIWEFFSSLCAWWSPMQTSKRDRHPESLLKCATYRIAAEKF